MVGYVKHLDNNKIMFLKVDNNRKLNKQTKIWEKVGIETETVSETVYGDNDKYKKAKIKTYGYKVNTNVQCKRIPKENASYKCFSLIMLNSASRVMKVLSSSTYRRMQI